MQAEVILVLPKSWIQGMDLVSSEKNSNKIEESKVVTRHIEEFCHVAMQQPIVREYMV